jgi:hypothetical protein
MECFSKKTAKNNKGDILNIPDIDRKLLILGNKVSVKKINREVDNDIDTESCRYPKRWRAYRFMFIIRKCVKIIKQAKYEQDRSFH